MRKAKTLLEAGETLIRSDKAGVVTPGIGITTGRLYLTTRRLFHETIMGTVTRSVRLEALAEVSQETAGFLVLQLGIFGFFIKSIAVYQNHGRNVKFTTKKIEEWLVAIQEAKSSLKV